MEGTVSQWNNILQGVVEPLWLEVFKMWLKCDVIDAMVLDNLIQAPFPVKGWTRGSFKVPFDMGCSVIL